MTDWKLETFRFVCFVWPLFGSLWIFESLQHDSSQGFDFRIDKSANIAWVGTVSLYHDHKMVTFGKYFSKIAGFTKLTIDISI